MLSQEKSKPELDVSTRIRNRSRFVLSAITHLTLTSILLALCLARRPVALEPLRFFVILGPRLAFAFPLLLITPWAWFEGRRWLLLEQLLAFVLVVGPLMGLNLGGIPHSFGKRPPGGPNVVRIMTYNIGPNGFDLEAIIEYLNSEDIHVLLVQEDTFLWRLQSRLALEKGWYANKYGTIFSRIPIVAESEELADELGGEKLYAGHLSIARLKSDTIDILVGSTHGPSLRGAFHKFADHLDTKELNRAMNWQERQLQRIAVMMDQNDGLPLVVGGDFNVPPHSIYSYPLEKRFRDVFAEIGFGYGYSFPSRLPWLRLDKFYISKGWQPRRCFIAPDFGSDHRPLFTELLLEDMAPKSKS